MLLVRLCFALVFDVGQLLALYFSLVVLFHSHICRLFWCFIIVFGFWDGNKIYDDDDTYHTGPIMLMLESMYVASQQCLWQPHFREVDPSHLIGASPPCPTFLSLTFFSIPFATFSCSAYSLCTGKWPPGQLGGLGSDVSFFAGVHTRTPDTEAFLVYFFCVLWQTFLLFLWQPNCLQFTWTKRVVSSDYVMWRHLIIKWGFESCLQTPGTMPEFGATAPCHLYNYVSARDMY